MNKKKIFDIITIPLKICLIICMAYGIYTYFNEVFKTKDVNRAQLFHNLPENSMDVIVLGSSHAQYSFIPSVFYQDTGLYSVIMGSACQPLEVSYQMLRETLKTQHPSLIILEVYTAMPLREACEADVCYVKAQYMMTGAEKYKTIDYLPKEKALSYYNEFINNHNNWREFNDFDELLISSKNNDNTYLNGDMGYIEQEPVLPVENYWHANRYEETMDVELDDLDLVSLNDIYNLCRKNGIQLLMYKTPIDNIDALNYSYLNKVWEWCDQHDVPYLDMIALQDEIDFNMVSHSDSYHCNIVGANAITSKIGEFAKDNFEFNHNINQDLDILYRKDSVNKDLHIYEFERNVYRALERIENQDVTLFIKYEPGLIMDRRLLGKLHKLGVSKIFNDYKPYYAIIENNKILAETLGEDIEQKINNHLIKINSEGIFVDEESVHTKGKLSIVACKKDISKFVNKNISINGKPWELGYDYFIKIK